MARRYFSPAGVAEKSFAAKRWRQSRLGFGDDRWRCSLLCLGARLESRDSGMIRFCPAFVLGRARRGAVVYQLCWGAESMPWLTVTVLVFRP
jgi:hypothetical protein